MAKIIYFPTHKITNTNGYMNLRGLFEICNNLESCNFYLESAEILYEKGAITEKELHTLHSRNGAAKTGLPDGSKPFLLWRSLLYRYSFRT